ncbi:hypothetical protein [Macrococcus carouselicus]|nr:hypothetical protein [Macrococcus carouselicus]
MQQGALSPCYYQNTEVHNIIRDIRVPRKLIVGMIDSLSGAPYFLYLMN